MRRLVGLEPGERPLDQVLLHRLDRCDPERLLGRDQAVGDPELAVGQDDDDLIAVLTVHPRDDRAPGLIAHPDPSGRLDFRGGGGSGARGGPAASAARRGAGGPGNSSRSEGGPPGGSSGEGLLRGRSRFASPAAGRPARGMVASSTLDFEGRLTGLVGVLRGPAFVRMGAEATSALALDSRTTPIRKPTASAAVARASTITLRARPDAAGAPAPVMRPTRVRSIGSIASVPSGAHGHDFRVTIRSSLSTPSRPRKMSPSPDLPTGRPACDHPPNRRATGSLRSTRAATDVAESLRKDPPWVHPLLINL